MQRFRPICHRFYSTAKSAKESDLSGGRNRGKQDVEPSQAGEKHFTSKPSPSKPSVSKNPSRSSGFPYRGYWTETFPASEPAASSSGPKNVKPLDGDNYSEWFIHKFWSRERLIRKLARKYVVLPGQTGSRVLVEWQSFEDLKKAYTLLRARTKGPYVKLKIQPTLWPLQDPQTTTMRISGISESETEESILSQFPYLSPPKRLFIQNFKTGTKSFAIWECSSSFEVKRALQEGPVGRVERARWRLRASATGLKVEMELRKAAGEPTFELEEKLERIQSSDVEVKPGWERRQARTASLRDDSDGGYDHGDEGAVEEVERS
ncbi:hypothetical protein BT69DRAFT_1338159 [Atractiella rhizophila]|nr:hypothetical protein BT69DRAFT_1338159 [Atractiella rhizophila]